METKKCNICGTEYPATSEFFYIRENKLRNDCKDCRKKNVKKYAKENIEKIKKNRREYYQKNKKSILKKNKNWKDSNKERIKQNSMNYYKKNKEIIDTNNRKWAKNNLDRIKKYNSKWYNKNKEEIHIRVNMRLKNKRMEDPNYKLICNLRHRLRNALKLNIKSSHTMELIGCSIEELWLYLETQFTEGMTRENYGKWHIDHIIPCVMFDFSDEEQQKKCFHYTNLRPLWANDNFKKNSYYEGKLIRKRI